MWKMTSNSYKFDDQIYLIQKSQNVTAGLLDEDGDYQSSFQRQHKFSNLKIFPFPLTDGEQEAGRSHTYFRISMQREVDETPNVTLPLVVMSTISNH